MSSNTKISAEITVPHEDNVIYDNKVTLSLNNTDNTNAMLGYEIIRNNEPVAFVTADQTEYTDIITTGNNKVYEYQIIGYDKLLNQTETVILSPVKIKHQGEIDRSNWDINTNMSSSADKLITADDNSEYCEDTYISAISNIIENGGSTGYSGKVDTGSAEFTIDLGKSEQITAVKYNGEAAEFTAFVSEDNINWTEVKKGSFKGGEDNIVYFNQPDKIEQDGKGYMYIYNASYVKIVFNSQSVLINNFNILGPTSDNVELLNDGIGILKSDFIYDKNTNSSIPTGSVIFTGVYKGSPAYNAVKLLDENGNIINGSQIIMAEDPEDGELGNVSEGIWIYWIEPDNITENLPTKVKAELYRVDNALTLENERLVSNTLTLDVPNSLPNIDINGESVSLQSAEEDSYNTEITSENTDIDENTETTSNNTEISSTSDTEDHEENNIVDSIQENPAEIKITDSSVEAQNLSASNAVNVYGQAVHEISITNDNTVLENTENHSSRFIFTNDSDNKKALMQLDLSSETITTPIALQTSFKVSDKNVTEVNIDWSDVINNRSILKECRFDTQKGIAYIYVVAKESLLDSGIITLGDIKIKTSSGVTSASLTLNPDSTVTLSKDFNTQRYAGLSGDVTLSAEGSNNNGNNSSTSGGSGSSHRGGGSSKRSSLTTNKENLENNNEKSENEEIKTNTNNENSSEAIELAAVSDIFKDVSKTDWYYNAVEQAYSKKWFMGTSETEFSPNTAMTRGMFVTVLGRFSNADSSSANSKFTDVPANAYYAGFVAWAAEARIVSGISDNKFAPELAITREQLAVMIYNYLQFKGTTVELDNSKINFTDDLSISKWAKDAVYYVQQAGIINGMPDGSFKPKNTATRAEVATILMYLDKKINE